jgi:ABC-type nitrate/sulfonate/bicarbonate transport system substrate-binding protein
MKHIHLAFKAYDVHELLCHAIAGETGLYTDAGLAVTLIDSTFVPDEALPENTFHAACGAALGSFLAGQRRKVVFVACDKPMFWLYGRAGIDSIEQLGQGRVATFPDAAPPSHFLRTLLADADVAPGLLPSRDDTARLALLISNSVDAALLSSLHLPHEVEARGARRLAFIGATQRLPSTGLAVGNELYEEQPELVAAMVEVYQQAMKYVYDDDETVLRSVLGNAFSMPQDGLDQAIKTVRDCYNPFGYSYESLTQAAVDSMAATMGLASRAPAELYEFKYIKSYH